MCAWKLDGKDAIIARAMEKLGMKTVEEAAEAIGRLRGAWGRFTGQK